MFGIRLPLMKSRKTSLLTDPPDNGSNIKNAAGRLLWPRLSCFGHNLHLAITKALQGDNRCSRALGVSRKVVSAFSISWKRRRELTKAQMNLELPQRSLVAVSESIQYMIIERIAKPWYSGFSNKPRLSPDGKRREV